MKDFTRPPQFGQQQSSQSLASSAISSEAVFFQKVYMWMCAGMAATAVVALGLASSEAWLNFIASNRFATILVFLAQIGLVIYMTSQLNKTSASTLKALFLVYASSLGCTFSLVLVVYPSDVIFKAFLTAASVFGAMAVYGLVTKRSLQGLGSFLFMGLIGLIAASFINFIVASPVVDYFICWLGVLIFAGLTAYDHQKLRVIHAGGFQDSEIEGKQVVMGSLTLYLDFINLFLFLLRIFGASRD